MFVRATRRWTPLGADEVRTAATVALLKRIPDAEVVAVDAGCCGMAGSFGFEAEHYEGGRCRFESSWFDASMNARSATDLPDPTRGHRR